MPSLRRKKRNAKKQEKRVEIDAEDEESAHPVVSPSRSPHPYHGQPPMIPVPLGLEERAVSGCSQASDTSSMEPFSDRSASALEYSDTSDENNTRGDRYFSQPISEPKSGESAFRTLRHSTRDSHTVIHYSSTSLDFPSDDNSDFSPDEIPLLPTISAKNLSRPPPPQPPPIPKSEHRSSWMANFAYSFRSTNSEGDREVEESKEPIAYKRSHRSQLSSSTMEFPCTLPYRNNKPYKNNKIPLPDLPDGDISTFEGSPLLPMVNRQEARGSYGASGDAHPFSNGQIPIHGEHKTKHLKSRSMAATISAFYLMDYEAGRPPTLTPNFEAITKKQLRLYRAQFSWVWRWFGVNLAVAILFSAHAQNHMSTVIMHTYSLVIFFAEIWMKEVLYGSDHSRDFDHPDRGLVRPLFCFLVALGVESWARLLFIPAYESNDFLSSRPFMMITSIFKPLVLFYISRKARHALEALIRISRIVTRVLLIEMFLILSFAAVACRMYKSYDSFRNLSTSWLSLFELSTTVVNPSVWMPMYETNPTSSVFFIFFIITSVFYLHSLVLSVVFQTYVQAAIDIHKRSTWDREEAIRLAFLALVKNGETEHVTPASVRKTLQVVRPHYSVIKIKALMDIVNPDSHNVIDYHTFRTNIRQALNASIRTSSSASTFAMCIELVAVVVAVTNFIYVILLTSEFEAEWFDGAALWFGSAITLLGVLELEIRFNPLKMTNFSPLTRLNTTFDGLATVAALVSLFGIFHHLIGNDDLAIDYILMGRAIDMIRIMRFFQIFRDVVRRSSEVLPAMAGPVLLVLTILHIFVYFGMSLWGDAIDVVALAQNDKITPLYYLNNFNSYSKGLVTMFNIFVVNDWHAIAEVFLYADRCSSPMIVYPFFILSILCGVFIMLNVVTAFFVEAFVTKLGDTHGEDNSSPRKLNDFKIHTGEKSQGVKRISSRGPLNELLDPDDNDPIFGTEENSVTSSNSTEIFSFDVYEREGFDTIMSQVNPNKGSTEQGEAFARSVCDYLEIFESLVDGREKVGYMVCCQQSMHRFGNRRFQNNAMEYVKEDVLQKIVSDMHSELLVLISRKNFSGRCLVRTFAHMTDPTLKLEIAASLLRHQPAVSLLVSRIRTAAPPNKGP